MSRLAATESPSRPTFRTSFRAWAARGDLRLVGRVRSSEGDEHPAEANGGTLLVGSRDRADASPSVPLIAETTDGGLRGSWRDQQTGVGRAHDPVTGPPSPNPAGHVCARRS